jgi:hypothetical protein
MQRLIYEFESVLYVSIATVIKSSSLKATAFIEKWKRCILNISSGKLVLWENKRNFFSYHKSFLDFYFLNFQVRKLEN